MFANKASCLSRSVTVLVLLAFLAGVTGITPAEASSLLIEISGPPNSGIFGETVTILPNGNFVVTDPNYPFYTNYTEAKGAVYLYSPNGVLISRLVGDRLTNSVGSGGITVLANGNFVVNSPFWDSATTQGVGAVTWCSQVTGCNGTVSASNSLVGSSSSDLVGYGGVKALSNGNYVVSSPQWWNGDIYSAGAVTWGNGATGTKGVVSVSNSLVGGSAYDYWDSEILPLKNGNYLILNPSWDNGGATDAGAVTWGSGTGGTTGMTSSANSLVGSTTNDSIGNTFFGRVIELENGSYVVVSPHWDLDGAHTDVGAITWGSGTSGVVGPISASNSLVGVSNSAPVGNVYEDNRGVVKLSNGNYVVGSPYWSPDGTGSHLGAVTWGSGASGVAGSISASNSLVGSHAGDYVGYEVIPLTNGNYVVNSSDWSLDDTNHYVGAVTWGNGASGISGPVSVSNSLIGRALMSAGGGGVIALANGNYAVSSPTWSFESPGPNNVGAVTWGNGTSGTTGEITTSNSLVGINTYDSVGDGGLVALTNGNFVAISTGTWSGITTATWVDGGHVSTGTISAANSLVGGGGVLALTNGNYVVINPGWDNGGATQAGAVAWGNGVTGTTGVMSAANSLVGSSADDQVGGGTFELSGVIALTNGNYVVVSPKWNNAGVADAGAITWGNGTGGTTGSISAANSLVGSTTGDLGETDPFGGDLKVLALPNGNYIVSSPYWNGPLGAGSITLGDGTSGTVGAISADNSLVNTCTNDPQNCLPALTVLSDSRVSIHLPKWSNGSRNGAISLIAGPPNLTSGPVSTDNSVLGTASGKGFSMVSAYDATRSQLIVGCQADNKVSILRLPQIGPPSVASVTRLDPTATKAASVRYNVIFSEPVSGVDMTGPSFDDFSLTTSAGLSGVSIAAVTGSGGVYTVTINTGSGNGTIRLDVGTGGHIVDSDLNPLTGTYSNGEVYSVIKVTTFLDVPSTYWASSFIERLFISGVTGGCSNNPMMYCPAVTVTRDQMAVFLLRGKHGSSYSPPPATGTMFADVPSSHWAAAWIEQLANEGITGGCGGGKYCPSTPVTRDQMAVFLLRGEHGGGYTPPAATGIMFADVSSSFWAAAWIEQLANEGITGGCGSGNYCPSTPVTRDQMAVFLVRAFRLP